jgi:hypothetical protein
MLQDFGENLFVVAIIMIGAVDECDADVDGAVQQPNCVDFIGVTQLALKRRTAVTRWRKLSIRLCPGNDAA